MMKGAAKGAFVLYDLIRALFSHGQSLRCVKSASILSDGLVPPRLDNSQRQHSSYIYNFGFQTMVIMDRLKILCNSCVSP